MNCNGVCCDAINIIIFDVLLVVLFRLFLLGQMVHIGGFGGGCEGNDLAGEVGGHGVLHLGWLVVDGGRPEDGSRLCPLRANPG